LATCGHGLHDRPLERKHNFINLSNINLSLIYHNHSNFWRPLQGTVGPSYGTVVLSVLSVCDVGVLRLQLIWTLSDDSDEVCERIITTGFHEDMLSNLGWDALSVDRVTESRSRRKICVVEAHINTLHNVVRRVHAARAVFRQCRAVDVVHKFRDLNEHPVIGSRPSDHYFRSVCLSVCLFVCLCRVFLQPSSIRFGSN